MYIAFMSMLSSGHLEQSRPDGLGTEHVMVHEERVVPSAAHGAICDEEERDTDG